MGRGHLQCFPEVNSAADPQIASEGKSRDEATGRGQPHQWTGSRQGPRSSDAGEDRPPGFPNSIQLRRAHLPMLNDGRELCGRFKPLAVPVLEPYSEVLVTTMLLEFI